MWQSWWQEIVAKLCFGKNFKRIKPDYCLHTRKAAQRRKVDLRKPSEKIFFSSEKIPKLSFSLSRTENQLNFSDESKNNRNQTLDSCLRNCKKKQFAFRSNWKQDKLNLGDGLVGAGWRVRVGGRWRKYMMLPGRLTEFEGLHKITRNKKTKYILLPGSQLPHPLHSLYLQTN